MNKKSSISRREFLGLMMAGGFNLTAAKAVLYLPGIQSNQTDIDMSVARSDNATPVALVEAAIAALGGMEAFVKPGDDVIIKPNIVAADYSYEYAA